MKGDEMTFEEMKAKADEFFEFPTANKDHVTTTSAVLFALEMYRAGIDAVKSLPLRVMFDAGVEEGRRTAAADCAGIATEYHHRDAVHFIASAISDRIKEKFGLEI